MRVTCTSDNLLGKLLGSGKLPGSAPGLSYISPSLTHIGGRVALRQQPVASGTGGHALKRDTYFGGVWVHLPRHKRASGDLFISTGNQLGLPSLSRVEGTLTMKVAHTENPSNSQSCSSLATTCTYCSNGLDTLSFPQLREVRGELKVEPKRRSQGHGTVRIFDKGFIGLLTFYSDSVTGRAPSVV